MQFLELPSGQAAGGTKSLCCGKYHLNRQYIFVVSPMGGKKTFI
jgi:hypothetical protein